MDKFLFYGHGGSGNRGCEAIVNTTINILRHNKVTNNIILSTLDEKADKRAGLAADGYISNRFLKPRSVESYYSLLCSELFHKPEVAAKIMYRNLFNTLERDLRYKMNFSIGGDNYCCENPAWLYAINAVIDKQGGDRILWGCSVEPSTINEKMKRDLGGYCMITARESITYEVLLEKGIDNQTCKVKLFPDPAFLLLPDHSLKDDKFFDNAVGINMSPIVTMMGKHPKTTIMNYHRLCEYILHHTDANIALIPHVIIAGNSDIEAMLPLLGEFMGTGRVRLLDDIYTASQLKTFISRCRFFVGARTHSIIAAYSTCIPTLAVGYSVKARGIARDVLGSEENMVISVQSLEHEDDLVNSFKYIQENEDSIRKHLQAFMPAYIEKAWQAGDEVRKLLEK